MSEQSQMSQYDQLAVRHNAALAAFTTMYEARFPRPVKQAAERESLFVPIALMLMIVASVLVSGSRTIVEFGGGLVGVMAFMMLEGAIIVYAFYRTRRHFNEDRLRTVNRWANAGLTLAFVVTVGANVHAVFKEGGAITAQWIDTAILTMLAISAPTLAFISGDILAVESKANNTRQRKADEEYNEKLEKWQADLNAAWAREKNKWGVKIEIEPVHADGHSLPAVSAVRPPDGQTDGHGHGYGSGYTKRTDARTLVYEHLEQYPDDLKLNVRDLAAKLNVGKTTAAEVMRDLKARGEVG